MPAQKKTTTRVLQKFLHKFGPKNTHILPKVLNEFCKSCYTNFTKVFTQMLQKLGHTCCKSCYTNFRKDFTEILHKECIATAVPQVGADVQIATDIEAACAPLARCDAAIAQVGLPLGLIPSKRRDRAAVATVLRFRTFCRRSWGSSSLDEITYVSTMRQP